VSIYDTSNNYNCANAAGSSRLFGSQIVADGGVVVIEMGDGSCP
jgi:hypothetical protein